MKYLEYFVLYILYFCISTYMHGLSHIIVTSTEFWIYGMLTMYVCMYVCMYICLYACMHAHTYVCVYVCMYVCMYLCMCVCVYIYIYIYMYGCIYVCMYICIMDVCTVKCRCNERQYNEMFRIAK